MTHFTKKMTMMVAALAMTAGTVSAQTLKAEIPFAFRVGKQVMQPGEYRLSVVPNRSGAPMFTLASYDTQHSVFVLPSIRTTPSKEWMAAGLAKLSFACTDGSCALTRLWTGEGDAYTFYPTRGKDGEMRIAELTMRPERAE